MRMIEKESSHSARVVVTTGDAFTDIDGYGSVIAYTELLHALGQSAVSVLPGALNASVPEMLRGENYEKKYSPEPNDVFAVFDVSDPSNIASFVHQNQIRFIADHHPGFKDCWQQQEVPAQIEEVGAACTQVFEYWQNENLIDTMPRRIAQILAAGILDNTLNLNAHITKQRDHDAYNALAYRAGLDASWPKVYFDACARELLQSPREALLNDTKKLQFPGYDAVVTIGQIVIWEADLLEQFIALAKDTFGLARQPWFLNVITVGEKCNYMFCSDAMLKEYLTNLLGITFVGDVAKSDRLYLRKEIMHVALDTFGPIMNVT